MQSYGERMALLDGELAELRQRIPKVTARIGVVEDEIEEVQHALQDLEFATASADQDAEAREQTRIWLRQEKQRLGQREDRIRQEKVHLLLLQVRLFDAKFQATSQVPRAPPCDIENARKEEKTLEEELVNRAEYQGYIRLLPPCLILIFLTALAVWFGADLLHHQPGLTTTQKVASIGSATFTIMTVVALFIRAAMCTAEWQWTLHACFCVTGWHWLKPMSQHRSHSCDHKHPPQQQQRTAQRADDSYALDTAPIVPQPPASEAASADNYQMDGQSDSPRSFDESDFEVVKKQS